MKYVSFDVDGVLVDSTSRLLLCQNGNEVDWDCFLDCGKLFMDKPKATNIELLNLLVKRGFGILIVTGRREYMRDCTLAQLLSYGVTGIRGLFMRPNDNDEPDATYKSSTLVRLSRDFNILVHFDDNPSTVMEVVKHGIDAVLIS
ncbi:HAD family acid phosphatase [Vulcanisaeta thermophila]|uniref:HAD family acid phosphatase n=1 Tax=Vulcanisaeta thermophila TaxID=867917 RepID=UPI0008529495|nr:HAD family acid phosphatase [Vulcanisaeta thermophila]